MSSRVIREAIDNPTITAADRTRADTIVGQLAQAPREVVYRLLTVAGMDGLKPRDSRKAMLRRLHNRLTAPLRARERAEV